MAYLTKEKSLFARDGKGDLLPVEVTLEMLPEKDTIKVIPLTKGEMRQIQEDNKDPGKARVQDDKIIFEHCIEPKYSEDEVKKLKPLFAGAIITAIMSISTGVEQSSLQKKTKEALSKDFL